MLAPGSRLGPYEVLSLIGKGGMGAVHKATDTRLGRPVAIKVLHGTTAEHRDRLQREAQVIAALQHPHICTLHDVGTGTVPAREAGLSPTEFSYLVMEHVEGHTIKGPLPLDKLIEYGAQIAGALDAAHAKGITHRDLKPSNIMVTRSGVKVLDFGIAQMTGLDSLTRPGLIGTPAYMAPEQWAGGQTDARTDIYALGLVLTELATGSREPDQALSPPALNAIVRGCLEKDPEVRWQSARDVRRMLLRLADATPEPRSSSLSLWWMAAVPVALVIGALAGWVLRPPPARPLLQVSLAPPPGSSFLVGRNYEGGIALSPDGRTLAFIASTDGRAQLWVRRLDSSDARPIPGTDGAFLPFWSPDSTQIAFFTADRLMRVGVDSGSVQAICATDPRAAGGAWLAGDVILVAGRPGGGIQRIAAGGGAPQQVVDGSWPFAMPDGKQFLYTDSDGVWIASIDAPDKTRRVPDVPTVRVAYSQGHLFFDRDRTLVAQPFDADRAEVSGQPVPVAQALLVLPINRSQASFSVSPDGMLVFAAGEALSRLRWRDRSGTVLGDVGAPAQYLTPRISPDGSHVAFAQFDGRAASIWIASVDNSGTTRLTFDTAVDRFPIWSPDSKTITFSSGSLEAGEIFRRAADGTGVAERLISTPFPQHPMDWSFDGRHLAFTRNDPIRGTALMILPMSPGATPYALLDTPVSEGHIQFNPDEPARWVAYSSDDTGRREVYVAPFVAGKPASGERRQISSDGGTTPRWRGDGRELYYRASDGRVMAARVDGTGAAFQARPPVQLFQAHRPTQRTNDIEFDVTRDGKRFLLVEPSEATTFRSLSLVTNWRRK